MSLLNELSVDPRRIFTGISNLSGRAHGCRGARRFREPRGRCVYLAELLRARLSSLGASDVSLPGLAWCVSARRACRVPLSRAVRGPCAFVAPLRGLRRGPVPGGVWSLEFFLGEGAKVLKGMADIGTKARRARLGRMG